MTRTSSPKHLLLILLAVVPIGVFFYTFFEMVVNIPFQDDFDALLEPTVLLMKGNYEGISGFWNILYTQDDERRIVVDRLVSYLVYVATGTLDLNIVMFLGLLTYLLLVGLCLKWFREEKVNFAYFLPIPFLIFTPINYEAVFWAMDPLQHIAVYIWAFFSLWLLSRRTPLYVGLGIAAGIISLYSDVSGSFVLVSGALVLLVQRNFKGLLAWVLILGSLVFYYYYNLKIPDFRPPIQENLKHFDRIIQIIITMPGMIVDIFPTLPATRRALIAGFFGLISLSLVVWLFVAFIRKTYVRKEPPTSNEVWVWGCVSFMFITFCLFALGRASESVTSILINRYKHMFVYWTIFNYLLLLKTPLFKHNSRLLSPLVFIISGVYFINAYFQSWESVDHFRKLRQTDTYEWINNRAIPSSPIYLAVKDRVDDILEQSIATGVYQVPDFKFESLENALVKDTSQVVIDEGADFISFHFPDLGRGFDKDDGVFVVLQSGSEIHILPTRNTHRSMLGVVRTGTYYNNGATSIPMLKRFLPSAQYTVYAGVVKGGTSYRLSTGQTIQPTGNN